MTFGKRNVPATFQYNMHLVLGDWPHANVYIDDVVATLTGLTMFPVGAVF